MLKKGCIILLLFLAFSLPLKPSAFARGLEDPAADLLSTEKAATTERYTAEEFSALSDTEKQDVYYNSPQLLPENFNPESYMDTFYPELQNTE